MDVSTPDRPPGAAPNGASPRTAQAVLDEGIGQLKLLCGQQQTGSAMLEVDAAMALFHLDRGRIVYLFFQGDKGHAGLQKLLRLLRAGPKVCRFRFVSGEPKRLHTALPPTERVLAALADRAKPPAPARSAQRLAAASARGFGIPLTEPMRDVIREVAAEHFGANADALCEHALDVDVLRIAFSRIVQGCADTASTHRFKHALRDRLKPLTSAYYKVADVGAGGATTMRFSPALLDAVERCAAVWLGDDAGPLCRQVFAGTDELRVAIDQLSRLIKDDEAADGFKTSVRAAVAELDEDG